MRALRMSSRSGTCPAGCLSLTLCSSCARFHSSWLTETVQKIVTDSSAVGAGVALGFALSAAGPAGVIVGAVVGTAAGNLLAKSADVIIGQQLRFIAKGTAAVATPAMALEVLGNDDFQTSIEELNADLKELEME